MMAMPVTNAENTIAGTAIAIEIPQNECYMTEKLAIRRFVPADAGEVQNIIRRGPLRPL